MSIAALGKMKKKRIIIKKMDGNKNKMGNRRIKKSEKMSPHNSKRQLTIFRMVNWKMTHTIEHLHKPTLTKVNKIY